MPRPARRPPATPTETTLHEAALAYLARYGATESAVLRVLNRRIARWAASEPGHAEAIPALREAARRIVARLAATGAINDTEFAAQRARSLQRAGKSGAAVARHLAAKGVGAEIRGALPPTGPEAELAAAAIHMRRKRLGPFAAKAADQDARRRELASFARAGFGHGVARQALAMTREEAEALITAFRSAL